MPPTLPRTLRQPRDKQRQSIAWARNKKRSDRAAISEGCYLLRASLTEIDPATFLKRYIQLAEAERAFRITWDELRIRPIWRQREDRVLTHILIWLLAYVLWKSLAQWINRAGLGDAPRTVIEAFARIKSGDVVLPAKMAAGSKRPIRLRCVTTPDDAQDVLLNPLGVELPQRLKRIDEIEQI